jgi:hypothetical protein
MNKTGRRIWYVIAIILSGLVLLISVTGIVGIWIAERAMANTVVQVLDAVNNVTVSLQQVTQGIDQKLENMQAISTYISTASATLSQNVTDQGLILLLLPEEKEQNLADLASNVKETTNTLRDTLSAGLAIYQAIDSLPIISLPVPSQEQIDNVQTSIDEIKSAVDDLQTQIASFRSGVSDKINVVQTGADEVTTRIGEARDKLANIDALLSLIQESIPKWQKTAITLLVIMACLVSLMLAWVIYCQVELIRIYVQRWKVSGATAKIGEAPVQTQDEKEDTTNELDIKSAENPGGDQNKD